VETTRKNVDPNTPIGEDRACVEKFTPTDLMTLRSELLHSGVDSFQAAEIVTNFLSGRGYGVCNTEARQVAASIETHGVTADRIQAELERVARVM
jgi:hypothetical protein